MFNSVIPRTFLFIASTLLTCDELPVPKMSMQCAVSYVNKLGFGLEPYKGDIEDGCNDAVVRFRESFYPALRATFTCLHYDENQIKCATHKFKSRYFDVYTLLFKRGLYLKNRGKLDKDWQKSLDKIEKHFEGIIKAVYSFCKINPSNMETISVDRPEIN